MTITAGVVGARTRLAVERIDRVKEGLCDIGKVAWDPDGMAKLILDMVQTQTDASILDRADHGYNCTKAYTGSEIAPNELEDLIAGAELKALNSFRDAIAKDLHRWYTARGFRVECSFPQGKVGQVEIHIMWGEHP